MQFFGHDHRQVGNSANVSASNRGFFIDGGSHDFYKRLKKILHVIDQAGIGNSYGGLGSQRFGQADIIR